MVGHDCIIKLKSFLNRNEFGQRNILRHVHIDYAVIVIFLRVLIVDPLKSFLVTIFGHLTIVHDLPHLGVQEGVSNYHLFFLNVLRESFSFERQVIEVKTQRTHASVA